MGIVFHRRYAHVGSPRRYWLIGGAIIAFLLTALWAKPIGGASVM